MGSHSDTQHKRTHPTLTLASKIGTRFTYPGGMEGWVDLGDRMTHFIESCGLVLILTLKSLMRYYWSWCQL